MRLLRGCYWCSQVLTRRSYATAIWAAADKRVKPFGVFFGYYSGFGLKVEHSWFVLQDDVFRFDFADQDSQILLNGKVLGSIDYSWGLRWFRIGDATVKSARSGGQVVLAPSTKRWGRFGEDEFGSLTCEGEPKSVTWQNGSLSRPTEIWESKKVDSDILLRITQNFRSCGAEEEYTKRTPILARWFGTAELSMLFKRVPSVERTPILPDGPIEQVESDFCEGFCNALAIWYGMFAHGRIGD